MTIDLTTRVLPARHAFGNRGAAEREHAFARANVPFFRERDGADPAPAFETLPFATKSDYRRQFPFGILAEGRRQTDPNVQRLNSSGTEGDRLSTVAHGFLLAERMFKSLNVNPALAPLLKLPRIRTARYAAPNCSDVECANPRASMADRTLPDGTLVLPVHHDLLTTPDAMIRTGIEEIAAYHPDMVYADPNHLAFLARAARRLDLDNPVPPEAAIVLSYSFATRVALRQIREWTAGANPVAIALAMSEFGYVGMSCGEGLLHLNDRDFYLELVALEDGESAPLELAITSAGDRLCPHIRYLTGDLYRLLPPCACGHPAPSVQLEGRRKDCLESRGRLFTPRALDELIGNPRWIDLYQLAPAGAGFDFRSTGDAALAEPAAVAALSEELGDALGRPVRVTRASYLPAARGGKFSTIRPAQGGIAA